MPGIPQILILLIGVCLAFMLAPLLFGSARAAARAGLRGLAGLAAVYALNFAAAPFGLAVGLNVFTAAVLGLLGLPGLVTLYATRLLFRA